MANIERNMAEGTPVEGGGSSGASIPPGPPQNIEGAVPLQGAGSAEAEGQTLPQPSGKQDLQRSWHISPAFDSKRVEEYSVKQKGGYRIFIDPGTGEEMARMLEVAGGAEDEGPIVPEPTSGPEWETSPERGRWLVEQITYMETELPYEVRWDAENGPKLYELCRRLTAFVEKTEQKDRYLQDHFDSEEEHKVKREPGQTLHDAIKKAYEERIAKGVEKAKKQDEPEPEDFTDIEKRGEDLGSLTAKYLNLHLSIPEREQVENDLLKYFKEAHRKGLLKGVDEVYNAIFLGFRNRTYSKQQALALLMQREPEARQAIEDALLGKAKDPEVNPPLMDLETAYILWTRGKLRKIINGEDPGSYQEGEWHIPGEEEEGEITELYWEPYGGYPNYYTIKARTPAQFRVAKESFLQMLKNKALGYDPNELMQNLMNFKQVLVARGEELALEQANKDLGSDQMTSGFVEELRQEFEGRAFLWHTFYNSEHYNKEGAKQGAMAMAMHEGPQRWVRALRSGEECGVGFHTFCFDNLAMIEFALNAQGSRGQFGDRTQVQEYIRAIIYGIQKERGMGIVLKDYDWRDVDLVSDPELRYKRAVRLEQLDKHLKENDDDLDSFAEDDDREFYLAQRVHPKTNQERIGIHQSAEALKALFDGFDNSDAHRNNYQEYVRNKGLDIDKLPENFPRKLRDSVKLGRIQTLMDELRQEVRTGTVVLGRKEKLIDKLVKLKRIKRQDKRFYDKYYADSETSFDVAMQMQGVTHETTIRGGAVYFVGKNQYVREYLKFRQDNHKEQKASDPDISQWSPAQRRKGFTENQHKGWILDEIAKGRRLDSFPPTEQALYNSLNPADRENLTFDHIPAHLAQKAGMAVVNWIRMKYRDDSPIWQTEGFKERVEGKDENDQYRYPNFRARYREAMVQKALERAVDAIYEKGFAAKFSDADYAANYLDYFDENGELKSGMIELQPIALSQMKLKRPHVFGYSQNGLPIIAFDENSQPIFGYDKSGKPVGLGESDFDATSGKLIIYDKPGGKDRKLIDLGNLILHYGLEDNPKYILTERGDGTFVFVEEVDLDVPTAADSWLALHTAHTYWAYQSNNTHTLLPDYVIDQARQIRDGKLRPEDADIFAGLLLTLDPTLCRVKEFAGEQMTLEGIVFDAAVEESLLGWVGVRNVFKERSLPNDGNKEHMGTGYYTEDLGGDFRFSLQIEALTAKMPDRWARRLKAALSVAPMHADTMAGNLGRHGVMGAVSMMDDKIHELTNQRIASQFAITKFINLMDSSTILWFALIGGTDPKTGDHHEGLLMKPTNNSEDVLKIREKLVEALQKPEGEVEVFHILLENFGRVWDTLRKVRTMYSDQRNAGGALDLRKTDVFLPNGRFNPAIALEKEKNTGTSRHIARMFWNAYVDWLLDKGPGGGAQAYPAEAEVYSFLRKPYYWFVAENGQWVRKYDGRDWAGWLFDKMAL
ncbi:MAG: hypothetical protein PHE48_00375 [Candidatus Daviesbacteria bacterium]|nr:hypothetical protein [Candidatus Daviesbacteria bacterium]